MSIGCSDNRFYDVQGNLVDFDRLEGQWVVLNYWALWCAPCREEIPELNQLDQQSESIRVLGVAFDQIDSPQELSRQIELLAIEFPVLQQDPAMALGVDRPQVLPTTLIIDPDGRVAEVRVGPQTAHSLQTQIDGFESEQ